MTNSNSKKQYVKSIKFNEKEKIELDQILNKTNETFSQLVKNSILKSNKKRLEILNIAKEEKDKNKNLKSIEYELNKLGTNLNQIAKKFNSTNDLRGIDFLVKENLFNLISEFEKIKDDFLKNG